jgi:hypothetical protein
MYYVDFWSYISIVYCVIIILPVGIKLNRMIHLCNAWEPGKVLSHVPLSPMKELRLCHTWEIIPCCFALSGTRSQIDTVRWEQCPL